MKWSGKTSGEKSKQERALDELVWQAQADGFYNGTPHSQRIRDAIEIATSYGQIDGAHHKMWVIDKMLRILCGSRVEYDKLIEKYESGEDGPHTYSWDSGIAP